MAVTNDFEKVSLIAVVFSRFAARVQDLVNRYQAWTGERRTREELMRLSDAELADIGLSRYQIPTLDLSRNA